MKTTFEVVFLVKDLFNDGPDEKNDGDQNDTYYNKFHKFQFL